MAVPADVIAGEIIEADWGNTIRDFACLGHGMGGADDASIGILTSTFADGASVTFTKPASWVTYDLTAWGSVLLAQSVHPSAGEVRIVIAGNGGTAQLYGTVSGPNGLSMAVRHSRTGLTADASISIQARATGGTVNGQASNISYIAFRTS